ncbi:MAG: GHKL domain-containing protein [Flavihumibacter sp.]
MAPEASRQVIPLLNTLEDILVWSKSQMDRFVIQPVTVSLNDLFAELQELYQPLAEHNGIRFIPEIPDALTLITDENLLSNAIQHSRENAPVVLSARQAEKGLICTINQTDAAHYAQLKDRLQRGLADSGPNGLGLFLIRDFLQKLNSSLDISYENEQLLIHVYLPSRIA